MNKKNLNKILNDSINGETPFVLSKIKEECKNITQIEPEIKTKKSFFSSMLFKRLAFSTIGILMFILGFILGDINPSSNVLTKETSIYLDVNPSIEIQLDKNNKVICCIAGNDDGSEILKNINLNNSFVDTALYTIVGSMYSNGYLNSETNSILVSVDTLNNNSTLLNDISNQINNVFKENKNMNCSIIAQKVKKDDMLFNKANNYGVSIGKMHLIDKIVKNNELYTIDNLEELSNMSIHELDLIYQSISSEEKDDEFISGHPGGFLEKNEAYNLFLENVEINSEDIIKYDVIALYHHDENHKRKMIYLITIYTKNLEIKKYIVDCFNAEIMPEDTIDEWKDKIPFDPSFDIPMDITYFEYRFEWNIGI